MPNSPRSPQNSFEAWRHDRARAERIASWLLAAVLAVGGAALALLLV